MQHTYLKKTNKYKAKRISTPDGMFDSHKEYKRYCCLKALEKIGVITNLRRQVEFELIPEFREDGAVITRGENKGETRPGKIIERKCSYYADFVYNDDGVEIVEDVKGMKTPEYIIKRKLMLYRYGIRIREV